MRDLTMIYYTANMESPIFEERIRRTLWKTIKRRGIKLISVSHKPIDFGKNICVGEVGLSAQNAWRQFQIGAIEADTRFVCSGEDDVLYAPDFFDFTPEREDTIYFANPMYVLWNMSRKAKVYSLKVKGSESSIIVGKNYLVDKIESMLSGLGIWKSDIEQDHSLPLFFSKLNKAYFTTKVPSVTFKNDFEMHRKTTISRRFVTREIPYWGKSNELIGKYFG